MRPHPLLNMLASGDVLYFPPSAAVAHQQIRQLRHNSDKKKTNNKYMNKSTQIKLSTFRYASITSVDFASGSNGTGSDDCTRFIHSSQICGIKNVQHYCLFCFTSWQRMQIPPLALCCTACGPPSEGLVTKQIRQDIYRCEKMHSSNTV